MAPDKPGVFVVFSWSPEGRSLISVAPETPPLAEPAQSAARDARRERLRRLNGLVTDLVLFAIAGFSLGYAFALLPN